MSVLTIPRISAALRSGMDSASIAEALGVTQSAIVQFIEDNDLKAFAAQGNKFESIDAKYNQIEEKLVDKLLRTMDYAQLQPRELAGMIKTINSAKRRSMSEGQVTINNVHNTKLVTLNLPSHVQAKVVVSQNNEVVQIDDRVVETIPNGKLDALADSVRAQKQQAMLPGGESGKKTVFDAI